MKVINFYIVKYFIKKIIVFRFFSFAFPAKKLRTLSNTAIHYIKCLKLRPLSRMSLINGQNLS